MKRTPKTRAELRAEGVELYGPIVPEWFKDICDGCSVPRGIRFIMRAKQGRAACRIHDWRYYCAAIANAKGDPVRDKNRIMADYELKVNRAASMRSRSVGWMFGSLYFRGVRAGGAYAMRDRLELMDRVPPTKAAIDDLFEHIQKWYPDRDGQRAVAIWGEYVKRTIKYEGEDSDG
jgi:hypothetical protein